MYDPYSLYGNRAVITFFRFEGAAPDGTVRPGADLDCMVRFEPTGAAGCNLTTQFCSPGAEIDWYLNGVYQISNTWTGYNESLGGYIAVFSINAPTTAGSYTITAHSLNDISFPFTVSAIDIQSGKVTNHSVTCAATANPPYGHPCPCDGSELILGYSVSVTKAGNGMAYLHVLVDGEEKYLFTTSTNVVDHGGELVIPCPSTGTHTITIRGDDEPGTTVTMAVGGDDTCFYFPCNTACDPTCVTCPSMPGCEDVNCNTTPCHNNCPKKPCKECPVQAGCTSDCDIFCQITKQPIIVGMCAIALAYLLLG